MEKITNSLGVEFWEKLLGLYVYKILGDMGFFTDEDVTNYAKNLSGGETARLAFAIITNSFPDLLILDEPTNNLDIETIEKITSALKGYKGAMVVISHDQKFINKLSNETTSIINI